MNKRRQRTEALRQYTARRRLAEEAVNAIEQHNFDKLVRQGVIKTLGSIALEGQRQRERDSFISTGGVGERVGVGELKVLPNP